MEETVDIILHSMKINEFSTSMTLKGFMIEHNSKKHLITVHHNFPINYIMIEDEKIPIEINSNWNEMLILNPDKIINKAIVNNNFYNRIPKDNEDIFMKTNSKRYEMKTVGFDFLPFDNLPYSPYTPFITAKFMEEEKDYSGLSGAPVFIDNKLVGAFCKYKMKEKLAYIIPAYIILKTLDKTDNDTVYGTDLTNITKINNYNVNDNMIYHPTLKIKIPIETNFMIEGDNNITFIINYNMNKKKEVVETNLSSKTYFLNSISDIIEKPDNIYMITNRFLILFKLYSNQACCMLLQKLMTLSKKKINNIWLNYDSESEQIKLC